MSQCPKCQGKGWYTETWDGPSRPAHWTTGEYRVNCDCPEGHTQQRIQEDEVYR